MGGLKKRLPPDEAIRRERMIQRLKAAIQKDGRTAKAIVQAAGLSYSAISDILNGRSVRPKLDTLSRIAGALGIPVAALLDDEDGQDRKNGGVAAGPGRRNSRRGRQEDGGSAAGPGIAPVAGPPANAAFSHTIPVLGIAEAVAGQSFRIPEELPALTDRPPCLLGASDAYALIIRGSYMEPRYQDGDLVWVHPLKPARQGGFVHLVMEDGACYVARYMGEDGDEVILNHLCPDTRFPVKRCDIAFMHRIVGSTDSW